jgi:putative membrane protein
MNTPLDTKQPLNEKLYYRLIITISIAVPVVVAILFYLPQSSSPTTLDLRFIPFFNACLNSCVSVLLVAGFISIRNRQIQLHKYLMLTAFSLSAVFLVTYVIYHLLGTKAYFGGEGIIRPIYFTILISHIALAAVILPFVLFTLFRALNGQFVLHKKIARLTFPLWLYVSVTGVIVYIMMAPYY